MKERWPELVISDQEWEAVPKIMKEARKGSPESREALQKLFDHYPTLAGPAGDLAQVVQNSVVRAAGGGDPVSEESLRWWLADMRKSLDMPGDGELERLLIQRVVISWLALNTAEKLQGEKWGKGMTLADATFWDRHVSRLDADFQRGCRTLAEIRRLGRPTVLAQMNIAEKQQINITAAPQPIEAADAEELES